MAATKTLTEFSGEVTEDIARFKSVLRPIAYLGDMGAIAQYMQLVTVEAALRGVQLPMIPTPAAVLDEEAFIDAIRSVGQPK